MFEGRIEWTGKDPEVIMLTDNGTRRVRIQVASRSFVPGRLPFEFVMSVSDVDSLIRDLQNARAWVKEG